METAKLRLDPAKTEIRIHTWAKGLLGALAHDLEIAAGGASGEAVSGDAPSADVRFPVSGLEVRGVMKHGRLDAGVLSPGDRADIERKIRDEVFAGGAAIEIHADVRGGRADVRVRAPRGTARSEMPVQIGDEPGGKTVRGACKLSLDALGIKPIKGPMGAFRVSDEVEIVVSATFVPA